MKRFWKSFFKKQKMFFSKRIELKMPVGINGKIEEKTPIYNIKDAQAVKLASNLLKQGAVIALPTDTVYGLACIANDSTALQNLYFIKDRENKKPVAICVAGISDLKHWGRADHLENDLLNLLLPGPVTVILEKSHNLENAFLNPGVSKIGIRIPSFPFIQDVCREIKLPLALTSANKSSKRSSLNIHEFKDLWPNISAIFEGGQLGITNEERSASTVVDLSIPGKFHVLRNGVAVSRTTHILNQFNITLDT